MRIGCEFSLHDVLLATVSHGLKPGASRVQESKLSIRNDQPLKTMFLRVKTAGRVAVSREKRNFSVLERYGQRVCSNRTLSFELSHHHALRLLQCRFSAGPLNRREMRLSLVRDIPGQCTSNSKPNMCIPRSIFFHIQFTAR